MDGRYYPDENGKIEKELIPDGAVIVARGLNQFTPAVSAFIGSEMFEAGNFFQARRLPCTQAIWKIQMFCKATSARNTTR
ncbi:hypothetical protein D3C80_2152810 [compost metagenome]